MREYSYKLLDFKKEDLDLNKQFFISSRYSMTSIIDCENLYRFSKQNDFSFFNLCVAAIYKTLESIPELRQFVIEGEGREYEHLNVILPVINDCHNLDNICVESIHDFNSFKEWNDFLENIKDNIKDYEYIYGLESLNQAFAVLSCVPWVHYVSYNDVTAPSDSYSPIVHWGKYEDGKVPVTITINHVFVYGYHLGLFFNRLSDYMANPDSIFPKIE